MNKLELDNNDEIDIFKVSDLLWNSKWVIISFTLFGLFCSVLFLSIQNSIYLSRINFTVQSIPPQFENNKLRIIIDLKKKLFSEEFFQNWKKSTKSKNLDYNDIKPTEEINGFTFTKNYKSRPVRVIFSIDKFTKELEESYIQVRISNYAKLKQFLNFLNYINRDLKKSYLTLVEKRVINLKEQIQELGKFGFVGKKTIDDINVEQLLNSKDYINSSTELSNLLIFENPTKPIKVSPNIKLTLIVWGFMGGAIGIFFVVILNSYRRYKNEL
jgi:LPS O-antigen subunit length determinant protein (WzzB/FepE family)